MCTDGQRTNTPGDTAAELFFEDVFVPSDRVLGEVGGGWAVTMYILSCERGAVAWQRGAWMLRRLEDLVRSTSGTARHARLGQLYAHLYALRLMSRRTLTALAEDRPVGPSSSVDKILMSTAEQALFDAALELIPELLTEDDEVAARWRNDYLYARGVDLRRASDIQRTIVAEHLLRPSPGGRILNTDEKAMLDDATRHVLASTPPGGVLGALRELGLVRPARRGSRRGRGNVLRAPGRRPGRVGGARRRRPRGAWTCPPTVSRCCTPGPVARASPRPTAPRWSSTGFWPPPASRRVCS